MTEPADNDPEVKDEVISPIEAIGGYSSAEIDLERERVRRAEAEWREAGRNRQGLTHARVRVRYQPFVGTEGGDVDFLLEPAPRDELSSRVASVLPQEPKHYAFLGVGSRFLLITVFLPQQPSEEQWKDIVDHLLYQLDEFSRRRDNPESGVGKYTELCLFPMELWDASLAWTSTPDPGHSREVREMDAPASPAPGEQSGSGPATGGRGAGVDYVNDDLAAPGNKLPPAFPEVRQRLANTEQELEATKRTLDETRKAQTVLVEQLQERDRQIAEFIEATVQHQNDRQRWSQELAELMRQLEELRRGAPRPTALKPESRLEEVLSAVEEFLAARSVELLRVQNREREAAQSLLGELLDRVEGVELSKEINRRVGPLVGRLVGAAGLQVACVAEGCPDPKPGALSFKTAPRAPLGGSYAQVHPSSAGQQTHGLTGVLPPQFRRRLTATKIEGAPDS